MTQRATGSSQDPLFLAGDHEEQAVERRLQLPLYGLLLQLLATGPGAEQIDEYIRAEMESRRIPPDAP